jgi:hypothetical protein
VGDLRSLRNLADGDAVSRPYDRNAHGEPGGCECFTCGVIFVGAEWHTECALCASGDWQLIDTAPIDGTEIQAAIPGNGADNVIACHDGFINTAGEDCASWVFVTEQEPPDCWTDGVCWEVNEDGNASVRPTHWKPLPASADTHRDGEDATQIAAEFMGGAVPRGDEADAQGPSQ